MFLFLSLLGAKVVDFLQLCDESSDLLGILLHLSSHFILAHHVLLALLVLRVEATQVLGQRCLSRRRIGLFLVTDVYYILVVSVLKLHDVLANL